MEMKCFTRTLCFYSFKIYIYIWPRLKEAKMLIADEFNGNSLLEITFD